MRKVKQSMLVTLLLLFFSQAQAQDSTTVQDFELWTGVNLKKSFLDDKMRFGLSQEFRFEDNATSINNLFTEAELGYKFFKGFRVDVGYRFIRNNRNSGYRSEGRFFSDINYKHKLDRFKFGYRFRFQNQGVLGSADTDDYAENKYRFRFKLEYNIRDWKFDPYFSAEGFFAQTTNRINYVPTVIEDEQRISGFEKYRLTLGTSYDITKKINVGAFYRYERELGSYPLYYNTPRQYFIAGLNINFDL
ncbi:MAG: DUF2490 domain-containing protein [bacterium]|nr:DUF2490 domain-containing protein [bacterium]